MEAKGADAAAGGAGVAWDDLRAAVDAGFPSPDMKGRSCRDPAAFAEELSELLKEYLERSDFVMIERLLTFVTRMLDQRETAREEPLAERHDLGDRLVDALCDSVGPVLVEESATPAALVELRRVLVAFAEILRSVTRFSPPTANHLAVRTAELGQNGLFDRILRIAQHLGARDVKRYADVLNELVESENSRLLLLSKVGRGCRRVSRRCRPLPLPFPYWLGCTHASLPPLPVCGLHVFLCVRHRRAIPMPSEGQLLVSCRCVAASISSCR